MAKKKNGKWSQVKRGLKVRAAQLQAQMIEKDKRRRAEKIADKATLNIASAMGKAEERKIYVAESIKQSRIIGREKALRKFGVKKKKSIINRKKPKIYAKPYQRKYIFGDKNQLTPSGYI